MTLRCFDLASLKAASLTREPFPYVVVPGFVRPGACEEINRDYPSISEPGSFPVSQVTYGPSFQDFLAEMGTEEFRQVFEEKFGLALKGKPYTITVRGRCGFKDGRIHTDTKSKIITILIYMNSVWEHPGGRLRLLKSPSSLEDPIVEVPPAAGTLLAFKRSDNSWHGHKPFAGERRVIQFNWVNSEGDRRVAMLRHHLSATLKRLLGRADRPAA
jgi:SM-20-related protein